MRFLFLLGTIWTLSLTFTFSYAPYASYAKENKPPKTNKNRSLQDSRRSKFEETSSHETFVVTAHRLKTELLRTATSITILTEEDLKRSHFNNIGRIIEEKTGIPVFSSGGPKHVTSLFLRGSGSDHTLVLVDGVRVNDPSSPSRSFDFSNLSADHIERIEILKGPQSGLYGSDAISGVIHIITKKARKNVTKMNFKMGSYSSFDGKILNEWRREVYSASFLFGYQKSKGISVAKANKKNTHPEKDAYQHTIFSTHLNFFFIENSNLDMIFRYDKIKADLDDSAIETIDDPNHNQKTTNALAKISHAYSVFNDFWNNELSFEWHQTNRISKDPLDKGENPINESEFTNKGENQRLRWKHDFYWTEKHTTTLGVEQTVETMRQSFNETDPLKKSLKMRSFYFQYLHKLNLFFGHMNLRYDQNLKAKNFFTYRVAEGLNFDKLSLILKTSYGTGAKSPSLYQLYSLYGNENLKNELSRGWDFSVIKHWKKGRGKVEVTYFDWRTNHKIGFENSQYINLHRFRRKGLELIGSERLGQKIFLYFAMNFLDSKKIGKEKLPRLTATTNLSYKHSKKSDLKVGFRYVGKRVNRNHNLPQYFLVNLSNHYQLKKNLSFSFWIENLLNKDYEEVKGYETPGLAGYLGISLGF